ncbi:MAG: hypothetical protein ACE5JS_09015 [Nitrospinota bacterium]
MTGLTPLTAAAGEISGRGCLFSPGRGPGRLAANVGRLREKLGAANTFGTGGTSEVSLSTELFSSTLVSTTTLNAGLTVSRLTAGTSRGGGLPPAGDGISGSRLMEGGFGVEARMAASSAVADALSGLTVGIA